MRTEIFSPDAHYHLTDCGANMQDIFLDDEDYVRFIFLLTHFQSPLPVYNISWYARGFLRKSRFSLKPDKIQKLLKRRHIELVSFTLLPDRFEILAKNLEEGVLSVYMQRILTSYGKYFNAKYDKKGHVFGGSFQAARVKSREELLSLSAEIHKRPEELEKWKGRSEAYPWSSYQDYIGSNRWNELLSTDAISSQFKNQAKYKEFVKDQP